MVSMVKSEVLSEMKALEVSVDGEILGTFVSPKGGCFFADVSNVPRRYMRASVRARAKAERCHWRLPDLPADQVVSFRMGIVWTV
jgi:hypothetical protein